MTARFEVLISILQSDLVQEFGGKDSFFKKISAITELLPGVKRTDELGPLIAKCCSSILTLQMQGFKEESIIWDANVKVQNESNRDLRLDKIRIEGVLTDSKGPKQVFEIKIGATPKRQAGIHTKLAGIHVRPNGLDESISVRVICTLKGELVSLLGSFIDDALEDYFPNHSSTIRQYLGGAADKQIKAFQMTAHLTRNMATDSIFNFKLPELPLNIFSAEKDSDSKWSYASDLRNIIGDDMHGKLENGINDVSKQLQTAIRDDVQDVKDNRVTKIRKNLEQRGLDGDDPTLATLEQIETILENLIEKAAIEDGGTDAFKLVQLCALQAYLLHHEIEKLYKKIGNSEKREESFVEMVEELDKVLKELVSKAFPLTLHVTLVELLNTTPTLRKMFPSSDEEAEGEHRLSATTKLYLVATIGVSYLVLRHSPLEYGAATPRSNQVETKNCESRSTEETLAEAGDQSGISRVATTVIRSDSVTEESEGAQKEMRDTPGIQKTS